MKVNDFKLKYFMFSLLALAMIFLLFIFYLFMSSKEYKIVKHEDEIRPIFLNGTEGYGYLRGSIFYKRNRFVGGDEVLVQASCKDTDLIKYNINTLTLKTISHSAPYRLSDLDMPFILSKKANNDTLAVKKDNCLFYFKLSEYNGPYQ